MLLQMHLVGSLGAMFVMRMRLWSCMLILFTQCAQLKQNVSSARMSMLYVTFAGTKHA